LLNFDKLEHLKKEKGMNNTYLCAQVGKPYYYLKDCKNKNIGIPDVIIQKWADLLDTTVEYLTDQTDNPAKIKKVPVYGNVAAGIPIEAITDIEDFEEIPGEWQGDYAALKIKGDSMSPRILAGDVVIIKVQDTVENGDIAVVIIDGESTCKRIQLTEQGVALVSLNPAYPPMIYTNKQIADLPIRIFGKVVELRGKF